MANCTTCGRELPIFSGGSEASNLCPDCRRRESSTPAFPSAESWPTVQPRRQATIARRFVSLTTLLVGANVAVFVLMALTGVSLLEPTSQQLLKWGANWEPLSLGRQPWRLLTSNYLHIGIIHLFFNMWCLLNLGALAERVFDRWTYLLV